MKKGWEYKTLGEIATFSRGLTYKKGDEVSMSKNVVLRSNNIDLMSGQLDLSELKYLNEDFNIPKDKKVIKDSLLICMSNGSKNHLGKVALIDVDYGYAFGGFMGLIVPVQCIKGKYLHIVMSSPKYKEYIKTLSAGANINNLKFADLSKFVIPVPPLSEQEEIVSRLDKAFEQIETMRRNAEQSLTTAQQLFQSTLSHLLTPQPHWDRKVVGKIKDICTKGSSNLKQKDLLNDGKYAVYGASGIAGYLNEYHQPSEYIGIVKDGSGIGRVDFYPKETSLIGTMQYILPLDGFNIRYVGYCLQSLDLVKFKQGAAIPHIYFRDYGEMTIDVNNNIEEQAEIVARLDSLSAKVKQLKDNHTRTVVLCDEMKQALLKEVFED